MRDDRPAALDNERRNKERVKQNGHRPGIRYGIGLTGPGAEAGVGNRSTMVVIGRFLFSMVEGARCGENSEDKIESRQRSREPDRGSPHATHGVRLCNVRTTSGASHSRGPTARPSSIPCRSMNTVVGKARTR